MTTFILNGVLPNNYLIHMITFNKLVKLVQDFWQYLLYVIKYFQVYRLKSIIAHFDFSMAGYVTLTEKGAISMVESCDLTGSYFLTQDNSKNQPKYIQDSENSHNVASFKAKTQHLKVNETIELPDEYTTVAVVKSANKDRERFYFFNEAENHIEGHEFGSVKTRTSDNSSLKEIGKIPETDTPMIIIVKRDSDCVTYVSINGESKEVTDCNTDPGVKTIKYIGSNTIGGYGWFGDICEIIVYDKALDQKHIDKLNKFLTEKWKVS